MSEVFLKTYEFVAFASPCLLHIVHNEHIVSDTAAKEVLEEALRLEAKYSYFSSDSVVRSINNRSFDAKIKLDNETILVLDKVSKFSTKTGFIFDIARAGTLKHGFDEKLLEYADSSNFIVLNDEIIFSNPYTKIDLGGVIKEYAVDTCVQKLITSGVENALVDFGGDIYALGSKNGKKWRIGIKNPHDTTKDITIVELENSAIVSSGHYERSRIINGEKHSHIVSLPNLNLSKLAQATVFASSVLEAGIFSTALLIDSEVSLPQGMSSIRVYADGAINTVGY